MSFSLGLDTGGTYTDAVIFDDGNGAVVSKAKALTTRHDLAVGLGEAAARALGASSVCANDVSFVSISTTLATNALVEGHGARVALVMIGFDEAQLDRSGLRAALGNDPVIFLQGGHDVHGRAVALDTTPLAQVLHEWPATVSAVAVAGQFSVKNPEHEIAIRDFVRKQTGLPVTCSRELSSKLDGPRRALTSLLNARLIGLIDRLISATRSWMDQAGIDAPLMIVRGDGSLVSDEFARLRPIETILSGPAASLVGAHFLTGADDAIVADIGGTTTDIALLEDGRPKRDTNGAVVGGFRTMVEAVSMRTYGLGADSAVTHAEGSLQAEIRLGPQRHVPVSMAAHLFPDIIEAQLSRQKRKAFPHRLDGRFAWLTGFDIATASLPRSQSALLSRLTRQPQALDTVIEGKSESAALDALVALGLVHLSGFTPSDALHVLGRFGHWNVAAAADAAELFSRRKDGRGFRLAESAEAMATMVSDALGRQSALRIVETALSADGLDGPSLVSSPFVERALEQQGSVVRPVLLFARPLIALGAAAPTVYPPVAARLVMDHEVPRDADVANAIGAVVGQVRVAASVEVIPDEGGGYRLRGPDIDPESSDRHRSEDAALESARKAARRVAEDRARLAGTDNAHVTDSTAINAVTIEGERQFLGATVTAIAAGRPTPAI